MKRNQSGFTLIEIAIVLVIIGLLLGGVLKGQELINSAKVKNLATDFRNIPVFIYGYQDKFRALPGDDATLSVAATSHLTGATACGAVGTATATCTPGNGLINGTWNDYSATSEAYLFWQHVRLAGLTSGPTVLPAPIGAGDGFRPVNAAGGEIGIQSGTSVVAASPINATAGASPIRGTYIICSPNILGKFAKQLDIQLDDGNTAGGSMMAGTATVAGTAMTAAPLVGAVGVAIDDAAVYTVCMGV
ncbi:MAG: prepilin-type N-terminal cleavage/methylation domain-containing protein [Gallionella sp.]